MHSKQPLLPSSAPSYGVPSDDKNENIVHTSGGVKRLSWGIFQVAYGGPVRHLSLNSLRQYIRDLLSTAPCATCLFLEIYMTARTPVTVHLLATSLLVVAPAFSLYLSASILGIVRLILSSHTFDNHPFQVLVFMWLFIAIMSTLANRIIVDTAFTLKGHLRAHFLPQLVNGWFVSHHSMPVDYMLTWPAMRSLPFEYGFEMEVPGFNFFREIVTRLRNFLTVVAEVGVLVMVISRRGFDEAHLLAFFSLVLPAVMLLKPSSGVGGVLAGYVFWTPNVDYYYLASLYKLAFSHHYRPSLERDGLCSYISQEYQRVSRALGYLNFETFTIQGEIRVQWYWDLIHSLIVDYPLALCALAIPWSDPLSALVTMVLVQHVTSTLQHSISQLRGSSSPDPLTDVLRGADRLYEAIAFDSKLHRGTAKYPDRWTSKEDGMKISFRNVSFRHHADGPLAVLDVSFDIPAGSLVLVVGANGSGKSSLLSLIQGLQQPCAGQILIDDKPLEEYDIGSVRVAMACLSQDEDMYPLSLRDNMLMGGVRDAERDAEVLDRAAKMGCASRLIERLPSKYDTILEPVSVASQSAYGCGNAYVTEEAMSELEAHGPNFRPTAVSGGEKQRLIATRMFSRLLRLKDRVRLIVCDEATGALDSRAESAILQRLMDMRVGKTVVFVTHRFGHLVKEANVIL
ncbi:P-loop containing nucleoside triphosphate hydrolase protein [Mycena epipterygia]|nr:P-loop containing nucleoside triphosphate hydrolase protein [Mycena epipterygia]